MASPEDLPNKSILKQSTNNEFQGNNSSRKSSIASSDQETYSRRSSLTTGSGRCLLLTKLLFFHEIVYINSAVCLLFWLSFV